MSQLGDEAAPRPKLPDFPSMKARKARALLRRLGYRAVPGRGKGSHTVLECEGRPNITWARHDKYTMAPGEVRKLLLKEAALTIDEAREVLGK
jgi:predicted RNA binding protein YcfA (HicA-like mRNA interferase family)